MAPEVAGIYCRLSLARFGDTTKVDDQKRICRELAAAHGWTTPEHFIWTDNNRSAWQRDRHRPGWDAMLEAVESGAVRNLVTYHGDRMIRQPYDLEILLNFATRDDVTIISPTGMRRLDIAEDRFVLRILADVACLESDNTSRRKKAGFRRMARDGVAPVAGGRFGRGFGYDTAGRIPVPAEADALRETARRLLAGEHLTGCAADLTARGITSVSGGPLTYHNLKRVLIRPRIAGLLADGSPGSWEPILDRVTWEMVCGVLRARTAAFPNAAAGARHLLSGIALCGVCRAGLQRQSAGRKGKVSMGYGCVAPGCRKIHRDMALLDAYVSARVIRRLASPKVAGALAAMGDPAAAELAQLEKRRAQVRDTAANLASHPGADLAMLTSAIRSFDQRIAELRAAAQDQGGRTRILSAHAGISREEFEALPLGTRRALVAACYQVTVLPASKRGPGFRTEDVQLTPR